MLGPTHTARSIPELGRHKDTNNHPYVAIGNFIDLLIRVIGGSYFLLFLWKKGWTTLAKLNQRSPALSWAVLQVKHSEFLKGLIILI